MSFEMISLKLHWILVTLWIANTSCVKVPEIEDCAYIDAHAVECWWNKTIDDENSNFRLKYKKGSDPKYLDLMHECSPNKVKVDSKGKITESCTIDQATIYITLSLHMMLVCPNVSEDTNCINARSQNFEFTPSLSNVMLREPPSDFSLVNRSKLVWKQPEKKDSMLFYFWSFKQAQYKLVYKLLNSSENVNTTSDDNWKTWYVGNKTTFILPPLLPHSRYAARVFAALPNHAKTALFSSPSITVGINTSTEALPHLETTTTTSPRLKTTFYFEDEKETVIFNALHSSLAVILFVGAVFFSICCCVYKKYFFCCKKTKIPAPLLMIGTSEMNNKNDFIQQAYAKDKEPDLISFTGQQLVLSKLSEQSLKSFEPLDSMIAVCQGERYVEKRQHLPSSQRSDHHEKDNELHFNNNTRQNRSSRNTRNESWNCISGDTTASHDRLKKLVDDSEALKTLHLKTIRSMSNLQKPSHNFGVKLHRPQAIQYNSCNDNTVSYLEENKFRKESIYMDYVVDSFARKSFPQWNVQGDENEILTKKNMEEIKRSLMYPSETEEKIADYVKQVPCFNCTRNEPMSMFVKREEIAPAVLENKSSLFFCENAQETMQFLLKHVNSKEKCLFCQKDSKKSKSCDSLTWPTFHSLQCDMFDNISPSSETSSLDSGYSPESTS